MPATTTAPRQEAKKARRQARTLLRRNPNPDRQVIATVRDLREHAVHAEPRHDATEAHSRRCNAYEPFSPDEAR